jgi:hypothetical protein
MDPSLLGGLFCIPCTDVGDKTAGALKYDLSDVYELLTGGWSFGSLRHEGVVVNFSP